MERVSAVISMEEKDRLAFALTATRTGVWTFKARDKQFDCDTCLKELFGFHVGEVVSFDRFLATVHRDDVSKLMGFLEDNGKDWRSRDVEIRIKRLDTGSERWVSVRGKHFAVDGFSELVAVTRDITDIKLHDAHVHTLMREVTHRSKNLLAIIQAMARQTVKDSLTAADFEERFSTRLRGLSFSHEILASQDWRGASLLELANGHLGPVIDKLGSRVKVTGPTIFVRPEAAQNIGLALNELGSNALKFGALSGAAGTVEVEWSIEADERGPKFLRLVWTESGGSTVSPPSRQGFGHRVVERVVARALDGDVNLAYAPSGLQWSLRIPTSHIAGDHDA